MKKIRVFTIGLFLFLAFFVSPAEAESIVPEGVLHVESYDVVLDVGTDSKIAVTETIRFNYADKTETGFSRYIPTNYRDADGKKVSVKISDLSINDENGKSYVFVQSKISNDDKEKTYLKLDIGDISYPVSGIPTYVICYTVSGALKFKSDYDQLYWNVTGDRWPVYVGRPEVKIRMPEKIGKEEVTRKCFIGIQAATIDCIDQTGKKDLTAYYSYKGVVAGQGMAVIVHFPKGVIQKPSKQENLRGELMTNRWLQGAAVLAGILFFTVIILFAVYFKKIISIFSRENLSQKWNAIKNHLKSRHAHHIKKIKSKSRKWRITAGIILVIIIFSGGAVFWKVQSVINKISVKGESVGSIVHAGLDSDGELKGEADGQINLLALGVLGAGHPGGGLNTDTIMIVSIRPKENKMSMVSIPRDLWVTDPGKETKSKINAVYAIGEERGNGQGMADMEKLIGEITGIPIHYTALVSTQAFSQLVDTFGGVEVELSKPFEENAQFTDIKVCDEETYTIPTGEYQYKKDEDKKVVAQYPLCKNNNPECGGEFRLPAGKNVLNGEKALCFARSRYLSNDFERAKRQQLIVNQMKKKVNDLGIADFGKINSILDNMGDNVRTDMQLWEMRRLFDLYRSMNDPKIYQGVLEDSKEGLLYSPDKTAETGFILLPRGDSYDDIKKLFQNIFDSKKEQSDIEPNI